MKTWKLVSLAVMSLLATSAMVSCQSDDDWQGDIPTEPTDPEMHTCSLVLNVSKEDYADAIGTRAAGTWASGDKIYLTFTAGSNLIGGTAIYDGTNWTINYFGSLTEGVTTKCSAVYFENAGTTSNTYVNLSKESAVYADTAAQYIYNYGTLSVTAKLTPKLGRVRFAGNVNDTISLYGIAYPIAYDYSTGKFTSQSKLFSTAVDTSGYTPYIYGCFTDTVSPRLNLITKTSGFTRSMPKNIYRAGESGYITIPSETKTGNWLNTLILPFGTQDVKLIPVEYSSGNFFLAETELTRAAYQAVMGTTTYTSYLQYPILLTPAAVTTFFSTVQEQTGFSFRVPTDVEWLFAASGGNVSQNYIYSGSNTIDEVGWYSGNSSSTLHYVKQLAPNELGFYDMTGNAEEHTYYSSSTWHSFGGSYTSTLAACKLSYGYISTYSYASTSSSYQYGLRIAMSH
jgi:hypothetical protein